MITTIGISEEELKRKIKTPYGEFELRILKPYEKVHLISMISQLLDVNNVNKSEAEYVRMITLLSQCSKKPDDFPDFDNCIDTEFLMELYKEYQKFEDEIQERLKKNRDRNTEKSQ